MLYHCYAGNQDIIDEAMYYFKANVFFKSYEVKVCLLIIEVHIVDSLFPLCMICLFILAPYVVPPIL